MRVDSIRQRALRLGLSLPERNVRDGWYRLGGIWRTPSEATAYLDGVMAERVSTRKRERCAEPNRLRGLA